MNTTGNILERTEAFASPGPVGVMGGVTKREVWRLVAETIAAGDAANACLLATADLARGLHPLTMLQLVTYCYATGTLDSQGIEDEAESDPIGRALCGGLEPTRWQVQQFRRQNTAVIKQVLTRVFRRLLPVSTGATALGVGRWQADWQSELAAGECLRQAVLLDSVARDE